MKRRVVVTGMGWITPLGRNIETVWKRLLAGESAIAPTTLFDATTFPSTFGAEVRDFDLAAILGDAYETHKNASRNAAFATVAARMAWEHAGLPRCNALDRTMVGVYLGGGEGPMDFFNFVDAAVAGWDPAAGPRGDLNTQKWAEVAYEKLSATVEFE